MVCRPPAALGLPPTKEGEAVRGLPPSSTRGSSRAGQKWSVLQCRSKAKAAELGLPPTKEGEAEAQLVLPARPGVLARGAEAVRILPLYSSG